MKREEVQKEALSVIKNRRRAGLVISMRIGKTRVGVQDMLRQFTLVSKFMVVAPTLAIFESWKTECRKMNADWLIGHIVFTTYLSLNKKNKDFDTVYLDECHHLRATHNSWLKDYIQEKGGRTVGFTGTYPPGQSSENAKMCRYYCPMVYEYGVKKAVKDNILNDYSITVHMLKLSNKKVVEKKGSKGVFFTSEIENYNYWTTQVEIAEGEGEETRIKRARLMRMKAIQNMPTKMKYAKLLLEVQKDKTIVFVETHSQADEISPFSYHSGNKKSKHNLENFQAGNITRLSAVNQISMGLTIPDLKNVIITHSYSNNSRAAQRMGRALGLNPKEKASIHILCYEETVDKVWVEKALREFDQAKIQWVKPKFIPGIHYTFENAYDTVTTK